MSPQMQTIAPQIANRVRGKMAREGVTGTKEELNATFSRRFNEAVSERRISSPDGLMFIDLRRKRKRKDFYRSTECRRR